MKTTTRDCGNVEVLEDVYRRGVHEANELSRLLDSEGGRVIIEVINSMIVQSVNRLTSDRHISDPQAISRLAGGIMFGRELLQAFKLKVDLGAEYRRRSEELEKKRVENIERLKKTQDPGIPRSTLGIFRKDAV